MDDYFKTKFLAYRLLMGLGVLCTGALILILFHDVMDAVPRVLLIGALLALPVGALTALSAHARACVACGGELETTVMAAPAEAQATLESASAWAIQQTLSVPARADLAAPARARVVRAIRMKCSYCPACRTHALLKVAGWTALVVAARASAN